MPIDLAAAKKQEQDALETLLGGRSQAIDTGLANTKSNVEAGREAFYGNTVNPLAARIGNDYGVDLGSATNSANAYYKNKLGQALSGTLASQRLHGNQDRVSQVWSNAYNNAKQAKANEQDARAYAYQVANQTAQQNFQASENAKNNSAMQRESDLKTQYGRMGLMMGDQYANQNASSEYEQAMIRALTGLAGSGVAAYGISRAQRGTQSPWDTPAESSTDLPYGPAASYGGTYTPNPNIGISYPGVPKRLTGGYQ